MTTETENDVEGVRVRATLTAGRRDDTTAAASLLLTLPTATEEGGRTLVLIATDDPDWWAELADLAHKAAGMATQPAKLELSGDGRIAVSEGQYGPTMVRLPYDPSNDEAYAAAEAAAIEIVRLYNRHILRDRPMMLDDA